MLYQWLAVSEERRITSAFYVGMLVMALLMLVTWMEVEGERHDKQRREAKNLDGIAHDSAARLSDLLKADHQAQAKSSRSSSGKPTEAKRVPIERAEEVSK